MDRRLIGLLAFGGVLVVTVVVILVARGGDDGSSSSTDTSTKPQVAVPEGPPPDDLVSEDIVSGDGDTAQAGDQVSVQYVGVLYDDGSEFDTSWDSGEPFQFQLGSGQVIPGWDQGVEGMQVGGRRQLVIPPRLAYGAQGRPGIPPNSTLVFVIDLLSVN